MLGLTNTTCGDIFDGEFYASLQSSQGAQCSDTGVDDIWGCAKNELSNTIATTVDDAEFGCDNVLIAFFSTSSPIDNWSATDPTRELETVSLSEPADGGVLCCKAITSEPTTQPTQQPTTNPTKVPTSGPTSDPTMEPSTAEPTKDPSAAPHLLQLQHIQQLIHLICQPLLQLQQLQQVIQLINQHMLHLQYNQQVIHLKYQHFRQLQQFQQVIHLQYQHLLQQWIYVQDVRLDTMIMELIVIISFPIKFMPVKYPHVILYFVFDFQSNPIAFTI